MKQLVLSEYYKLWKSKSLYSILALCMIPVIFGFFIYFRVEALAINEGAFDILSFPNNMWQFFVGTSLPIIILAYMSASLGRELRDGTYIYQVTRIANRKRIIFSKVLAILSLNILYFLLFILVSFLSYLLFIQDTVYAGTLQLDSASMESMLTSLLALCVQIAFCLLSLFISLKISTIGLVSVVFISTSLLSMLSNVRLFAPYLPGSIFYAPHMIVQDQFLIIWFIQIGLLATLSLAIVKVTSRIFKKF